MEAVGCAHAAAAVAEAEVDFAGTAVVDTDGNFVDGAAGVVGGDVEAVVDVGVGVGDALGDAVRQEGVAVAHVRKLRDDMAGLMPHAPLVHAYIVVVVGVEEVEEVVGDGHEQHEVEGGEGVVDDRLPEDMTYPAAGAGEEVQRRMDQEVRLDVGWKDIDRRRVGYGVAGWVVLENPVAVEEEVGEEIVGRLAGSSGPSTGWGSIVRCNPRG
ncbi:predicted protein [Histoplasma mississippiense (nom. inval.)]|uniref:predicted protein n=1 Tax=Ajellomyces capsulatus (strain NAm1 / WU24) TaxID=2059318 RepID=UPI000157BCA6|nr:predicted protein [Histoplasma mississippiense (nom. inval.)]EDN06346.1 predicted protein [Histoplasma mississippiense (nom. inval.)]